LLERVGLHDDPDTPINQIGVGKQQLVEIAKALSKKCSLLILDEPTAALNEKDSKNLLDLLKSLQAEGMTCIIISHKLNEIVYVADSVTVLRDGQTVADFEDASEINEDEIIRHMVGRELSNRYPTKTHTPSNKEVILEVKNWNVGHPEFPDRKVVKDLSIKLHKGEVVGLSGLMGAGRTEFAMSLFGKSYGASITGEVYKEGKQIDVSTVSKAIDNGIYVRVNVALEEGFSDDEILDFVQLTLQHNYDVVFMPTIPYDVIKGKMKLRPVEGDFGDIELFKYVIGRGRIGFLKEA
jgi:putative multiple sugar transport system ATP-binding protein